MTARAQNPKPRDPPRAQPALLRPGHNQANHSEREERIGDDTEGQVSSEDRCGPTGNEGVAVDGCGSMKAHLKRLEQCAECRNTGPFPGSGSGRNKLLVGE